MPKGDNLKGPLGDIKTGPNGHVADIACDVCSDDLQTVNAQLRINGYGFLNSKCIGCKARKQSGCLSSTIAYARAATNWRHGAKSAVFKTLGISTAAPKPADEPQPEPSEKPKRSGWLGMGGVL